MTEREALLRAVCENPDDDLPRLVFADWLDEHDEPKRAEFIRLQCRVAEAWRLGQEIDNQQRDRESLLWMRYKKRWMAELPIKRGVTWHPFFSRGFAYALNVTKWQRLRAVASEVLSSAPITVMRVGMVPDVTEFVAVISTLRLVSLNLSGAGLDDAAVREMLGTDLMNCVRQLDLRGNPISAGVQRELTAEYDGRVLVGDIEYIPL